jgi:hypothetical protein
MLQTPPFVSVTKTVGFKENGKLLARWKDRKPPSRGACHANCHPTVTRSQAENRKSTNAMSILCRGNLSTLGESNQTGS